MVDFIGAARDPQFRQDVGRGLVDSFGRGLSMIGGAPVDLTTMFLRPLGYSVPDEQIVGSSEYIGRQMANLGLISETRNPVAEFLSALLIPDPTDIQKLAPYVQRAMNADLVAPRPSTPGAAMMAQRGSVGFQDEYKGVPTARQVLNADLPEQYASKPSQGVLTGASIGIPGKVEGQGQPFAEWRIDETMEFRFNRDTMDYEEIYEPYILLEKLFVPEDQRGQGAGRKVLNAFIEEIKSLYPGIKIRLSADPDDADFMSVDDLVDFYKSAGFKEILSEGATPIMEYKG